MTTVVAQGTFDIIHPGHVYYLREAASMGDFLHVIVARRENVTHKETPILPDGQRREVVEALEMVDEAHVGNPDDIFAPIETIQPDVIALGFDQHHDTEPIQDELDRREINCTVSRTGGLEPRYTGELLSTGDIIDRIIEERG